MAQGSRAHVDRRLLPLALLLLALPPAPSCSASSLGRRLAQEGEHAAAAALASALASTVAAEPVVGWGGALK